MKNSREQELRRQIDAYIKGNLEETEIQALWNEFAKNPELLDLLELEINIKELIEQEARSMVKEQGQQSSTRKLPRWTWHAAAAAAIVIVALVQIFRVDNMVSLDQVVVQNIEPAQIETSDAIRSKELIISSADSLLNLGFQAFLSEDNERALHLYETVISNHAEEPYVSKAYLNMGIIHYNIGDHRQAIDDFEQALEQVQDSRMITEKAYWYLGNALIQTGELEEAKNAVTKTYQLDGVFKEQAFRLLTKLNEELRHSDPEKVQ